MKTVECLIIVAGPPRSSAPILGSAATAALSLLGLSHAGRNSGRPQVLNKNSIATSSRRPLENFPQPIDSWYLAHHPGCCVRCPVEFTAPASSLSLFPNSSVSLICLESWSHGQDHRCDDRIKPLLAHCKSNSTVHHPNMAAIHPEAYDLLIITDATYSMGTFLQSLNSSLQDIIRISATTACFSRIGVLAYRDYDWDGTVTQWSGWHSRGAGSEITRDALLFFARTLRPVGGNDWPEATKTGLAHAYELMRPDAKTVILLYADAPPHMKSSDDSNPAMLDAEQAALSKPGAYGGHAARFADWTSVATTLATGEKRAQVFTIIGAVHSDITTRLATPCFAYLSARTGGVCITLPLHASSTSISRVTVGLLIAWMGVGGSAAESQSELASLVQFMDVGDIDQLTSETDVRAVRYLPASRSAEGELRENLIHWPLPLESMTHVIPRREDPVMDFAKRYKADLEYRELVVEQLAEILESDVSAIALNPVFGALWRTFCNDRSNPARDGLVTKFGAQVDRISDAEKKAAMKIWLEESYDMTGEIIEAIESVPEEERYPCVFLDPTLRFAASEGSAETENGSMEFTRAELLEIGRSCDHRILRRLGGILTRLTYLESAADLPAHIVDVPVDSVPRIPMALVRETYQRRFWKALLHTVLPGTMLAARPAALLAALSLRMGIKPLEEAAITELLTMRDKWNTLDIPETWNSSCLALLLEADQKHQWLTATSSSLTGTADAPSILKAEDRRLFQALVDYKLLEMNLGTSLTAQVGWTPSKSKAPLGPVVVCKACQFPRSVSVMADGGICGLCTVPEKDVIMEGGLEAMIHGNVTKTDDATTQATWSECSIQECRAQYVVYHPKMLNVRAKCHYCRQKRNLSKKDPDYERLTTAPCVTCVVCTSRVIWPTEYRPSDFNSAEYHCPACTNNQATIIAQETTPRALASENGSAWLLRNDGDTIKEPFSNRSLFHVISTAAPDAEDRASFADKVEVLPSTENLTLTLRGKTIHNTPELVASLGEWVSSRRVEIGTCTLCFATHKKRNLRLACGGRKGCREPICGGCAQSWYGINRPGAIINVSALSCPFCRRRPTAKMRLPDGLRALGGLRDAVDEAGRWIYAWCTRCGKAKRYLERVCAQGAPPEPAEGWRCEECAVATAGQLVVKECPGCGVATQKTAGCDHIACPCGAHWCFFCGANVGEDIYNHMSEEHGGWYGGGDVDEGDYDTDGTEY